LFEFVGVGFPTPTATPNEGTPADQASDDGAVISYLSPKPFLTTFLCDFLYVDLVLIHLQGSTNASGDGVGGRTPLSRDVQREGLI
jgi:hypothetical protein